MPEIVFINSFEVPAAGTRTSSSAEQSTTTCALSLATAGGGCTVLNPDADPRTSRGRVGVGGLHPGAAHDETFRRPQHSPAGRSSRPTRRFTRSTKRTASRRSRRK